MTAEQPVTPVISITQEKATAPRGEFEAGTKEDLALLYLRQARTAVVTMAVLAVAAVIASVIIGIVVAVGISHENKMLSQLNGTTSSNCLSKGGPDPSC
jgi:hypothetical protein